MSLYNVGGEGQVGIPFAVYPSACSTRTDLFEEAGLDEPPHEWGEQVHDARWLRGRLGLRHGPPGRAAADRRQERQGRDPGRLRPREDRPVGLRAAARRPAPDRRLLEGRHADGRRRQDGPDPRRLGRRVEVVLRRHVDGPLLDDRPGSRAPTSTRRLPVLHRQRGHERELPLVDLRRRRRRRRLGPGGDRRPTTARPRPRSTPTRSAS